MNAFNECPWCGEYVRYISQGLWMCTNRNCGYSVEETAAALDLQPQTVSRGDIPTCAYHPGVKMRKNKKTGVHFCPQCSAVRRG